MATRWRLVMSKYKVCDCEYCCGNVNFAFRGVCNRCGTARPSGSGGAGSMGGGRGRGRGSNDPGAHGRAVGGPTAGLFGPNDWPCPMCGNINWAKRMKCNICNTNKPGHNEGGVRGGRGGGYKELDEEEIEETRRRRREAEEDDGEMYDEFGNLKKKFRAKMQQADNGSALPGSGRAGWEVELGRESKEGSKDRGRDHANRESSRSRGRDGHSHERDRRRSRSRERERDHERSRDRDRGSDRERVQDHDRGREYGRERDRHRDR
uniref:Zinc finger Ran-binding domain-containing protein 2 n=1 Tax=Anthurium amnicola TaxID=1678845 RepID=A0A1D1YE29_9ARAE